MEDEIIIRIELWNIERSREEEYDEQSQMFDVILVSGANDSELVKIRAKYCLELAHHKIMTMAEKEERKKISIIEMTKDLLEKEFGYKIVKTVNVRIYDR